MDPLVLGYIGVYLIAIAIAYWGGGDCRRFVREVTSIDDAATFDRFKAVARRNMKFALVQLVVMMVGVLGGIALVVRSGVSALAAVLLVNGVLIAVGKYQSGFENAARSLPAAPELEEEYTRVSKSWVSKPLPDF